jgi:hypothetical protein
MKHAKSCKAHHGPSPRTITQAELHKIAAWRLKAKRYDRLRTDVLARMRRGATIEPGPLTAKVVTYEAQPVSWRLLVELCGLAEVRELQARAPTKVYRQLRVKPAKPLKE